MQRGLDGTSQGSEGNLANSGFVNVQSATGMPVWRLEDQTRAFERYDFGFNASPWIPEQDWATIIGSYFPGCDRSLKELVQNSPAYTDWRSAKRAITKAGSCVHIVRDGPVWMSTQNSYDAGIEQVIRIGLENESRHRWRQS